MERPTWKQLGVVALATALFVPAWASAVRDARRLAAPLPRVLLIGDSISKGYAPFVRLLLTGEAVVAWPAENCHATVDGLARLDRWLGDERWDVVHFNFGLHDLKWTRDGRAVAPGEGLHHVPVAAYEANLERIVTRLEATGATLVWASTTPVPPGARWRAHGDAARYNVAALRVMRRHGVAIDDLHGAVAPHLESLQRARDVHFTPYGYLHLAYAVVASVRAALERARAAPLRG